MTLDNLDDCLLCQLVDGRLATSRVHEDEHVVAFMDHQPVTPGHVLVVPRQHAVLLDDLDEELSVAVYRVAHRLTRALRRSTLRCEGVNLFLADGEAAFQEVPHVHLHVFPRFAGDTFRIAADWRIRDRPELDDAAAQVRAGLAALAGVQFGQPPRSWTVWRQDDNGNQFEVAQHDSRADAEAQAATMEARGHKQTYWVAAAN
jgi:diadenosine tetraphosphate (Ap4A) HIT family hydrolase